MRIVLVEGRMEYDLHAFDRDLHLGDDVLHIFRCR